jgi:hypothetical protein
MPASGIDRTTSATFRLPRQRYPVDKSIAQQEQHCVGDLFGPAASPNRDPFSMRLDECVLALARELID